MRMASVREGNFRRVRRCSGRWSSSGGTSFSDAMDQDAQLPRVHLSGGFVNGHDAPDMQRRIAVVLVAREQFGLRMHHLQFAAIAVELDLAEQSHAGAGRQTVGQISPVEPFAEQNGARGIGELGLEEPEVAPREAGSLSPNAPRL